jgi:hypothetical protein
MEYKRKMNADFTRCELRIFHQSSPTELHRQKGSSKFVGTAEGITSSLVRQDLGSPGLLLQHDPYGNPSCYCSNFCKLCSTNNMPDVWKPGLFLHQFLSTVHSPKRKNTTVVVTISVLQCSSGKG